MTASVSPRSTAATTHGTTPGIHAPEASPPTSTAGPILLSVMGGVAALVFSVIALVSLLGPGVVESSSVEGQIQSRITSGTVTCAEDLPAEVGASISCSVYGASDDYSVRATVTSVDGDDVSYRLEQVG